MNPPSPWTSLEVAKLLASTLTPVSVAILGLFLGRAAKRLDARQWASQKVVEKRLAVYDLMAPQLNDLFCYLVCVGNYKELTPADVIQRKRSLDKHAHVYGPLFSPSFFQAYEDFLKKCFRTWSGEGYDARILASPAKYKLATETSGKIWDPKWDEKFDASGQTAPKEVQKAYTALMACFSAELGVGLSSPK